MVPVEPSVVAEPLPYWTEVLYASLGVVLSVLMPFLLALVKRYWPNTSFDKWDKVWDFLVPYVVLGAFAIVVGLVVAAAANFETRELALLGGFAWDKTLQVAKIVWEA